MNQRPITEWSAWQFEETIGTDQAGCSRLWRGMTDKHIFSARWRRDHFLQSWQNRFFESGNLFLFKFFVNIRVNIECWNKSLKSSQASANRLKPNFSFHLLNPKWCQPPRFPARLLDAWQEEDVPGTAGEIQQGERLGRSVELGQDAWPGRCHVWIRI